jgi:hypothetical protein
VEKWEASNTPTIAALTLHARHQLSPIAPLRLAIDQLHHLLRSVGNRHLRTDNITDESGKLRVIFRAPNWEDFVILTCTELRRYGTDSIQVVRRLRTMIESLIGTLPEHRHANLQAQLALLDQSIRAVYNVPEELALAMEPDSQGLGGTPIWKSTRLIPPFVRRDAPDCVSELRR